MKRTIYLVALCVVTCICVIVGIVIHTGYEWNDVRLFSGSSKDRAVVNTTKSLQSFKNISASTDTTDISIQEGDTYQIKYVGPKDRKPKMYVENDTLYVEKNHNMEFFVFNFGMNQNDSVEITVPKDTDFEKVDLNGNVSDFFLSDVSIEKFRSNVDTGDIHVEDSKIADSKIETDTGDIKFEAVDMQDATLSTDTGDISIRSLGSKDDFNMDFSTDVGDILVNGKEYNDTYRKHVDTNRTIHASTDTGDVEIDFEK